MATIARCGCGGPIEGVSVGVSDCVAISGSGTAGDPFVPVLILSEDADNAAECRDDGLYVDGRYLDFAFHKRTAGNLTLNNFGSWANVSTSTDLVLGGIAVGDVVEVDLSCLFDNEAPNAYMDAASVVAGAAINYWGTAGGASDEGIQAWLGLGGVVTLHGGGVMKTIVAGDLESGQLTLRLRYRTSAASAKTLQADAANPLQWYAKNLGPQT